MAGYFMEKIPVECTEGFVDAILFVHTRDLSNYELVEDGNWK